MTIPSAEDDPFTITYVALLQACKENVCIRRLVSEGNLIDFTQTTDPQKSHVATADVPELVLYMSGMTGNLHSSSSDSSLTTVWRFVLSSGTFDTRIMSALSFAVLQVMAEWQTTLKKLRWSNAEFIKDVRFPAGNSGHSNRSANRNITGWATILDFEISMRLVLKNNS